MTPEQEARDILERMEINGAQSMTSGDVVELANIIADYRQLIANADKLRNIVERIDEYPIDKLVKDLRKIVEESSRMRTF